MGKTNDKKKMIKTALMYAYLEGSRLTDRGFELFPGIPSTGNEQDFEKFKKAVKLTDEQDEILTECIARYFETIVVALADFDLLSIKLD